MFSSTVSFAANVPTSQGELTDICLFATEDYFVVVSVPESKVETYRENMEVKEEFFQAQLQEATRASQYPGYPGRVVSEQYMYFSHIKREINNTKQQADYFNQWMKGIHGVFAVLESVVERWMRRNIPEAENRPYPKWARVISLLILCIVFYGIMKE